MRADRMMCWFFVCILKSAVLSLALYNQICAKTTQPQSFLPRCLHCTKCRLVQPLRVNVLLRVAILLKSFWKNKMEIN